MDSDAISPSDLDLIARTIMTEDATPEGRAAVASVIKNRMQSPQFPNSAAGVVLQRNAFEPVGSSRWRSASPSSPDYQNAYDIARRVMGGDIEDPTGGAVNFYAPVAQAKLGRAMPDWAAGRNPSAVIGGQVYYAPVGAKAAAPAAPAFMTDFPVAAAPAPSDNQGPSGDFLKDFPIAPATSAKAAPAAAASPASSNAPDFQKDFQVAPSAAPQSAPAPVKPATELGVNAEFLNSLPVVGPTLEKAGAGVNALLAPAEPYLGKSYSALTGTSEVPQGATLAERYTNALAAAERDRQAFESGHPIASTAVKVGGALAGTAPLMLAAPAAFGASAASLPVNAAISGLSGAALNTADTAARQGFDVNALTRAAEIGGAFGAAGPVAGKAIGAGINWLSNLANRTTPAARNVAGVLSDVGMTPQEAANALTKLGPYGTLADVNPALATEAGALAAKGGSPTAMLKSAMMARAAGADDRVADTVATQLGPRPDVTATEEGIKQSASTAAAPYYNAARASAQPMDVTPVLSYIDGKLASGATGGVADALSTAKGYLTKEVATLPSGPGNATNKVVVPKDDPQALLGARQALDDFIERRGGAETTAGKNALREATAVRSQLDGILKTDPNIAAGDILYSSKMSNLDAFHEGQDLFKGATRIEDVNRSLAGKTPEQIDNMRQGALASVHDALDNARQGDFSAARSLFGKSTANRAKLDALFPNSGAVLDKIEGEMAMRNTERVVAQNSATAERQAVQQKYAVPSSNPLDAAAAIAGEGLAGGPGALGALGARAVYSGVRNALLGAAADRLATGTARGLSASGQAAQDFLGQVARAYGSRTSALSSGGNTLTNLLVRSPASALRLPF